jgi:hypothetical protein
MAGVRGRGDQQAVFGWEGCRRSGPLLSVALVCGSPKTAVAKGGGAVREGALVPARRAARCARASRLPKRNPVQHPALLGRPNGDGRAARPRPRRARRRAGPLAAGVRGGGAGGGPRWVGRVRKGRVRGRLARCVGGGVSKHAATSLTPHGKRDGSILSPQHTTAGAGHPPSPAPAHAPAHAPALALAPAPTLHGD